MVPSRNGSESASFTSRRWSSRERPVKRRLATGSWKWSPPPVRSTTCSSVASGNACSSRACNGSVDTLPILATLVCQEVEEVGARQDADRPPFAGDDERVGAPRQGREHLVERH